MRGHRCQYGACALGTGYLRLQTDTLRSCNTHCFSFASVVARTRINIGLHVHFHIHPKFKYHYSVSGTAVAQWLRCCATNRKVDGLISDGVIGFFFDIKSFRSHYGPGVDSASNRNEYQEHFLGVKAAGA